jgi:ABC-2 type transport system ATP-binding protein
MIQVEHLTKNYGRTVALDDVSFEVKKGEIVGFLGPNGAGKSTTMRILTCYLPPTSGRVTIAGLDILRDSIEVRRRIGYLPENFPVYMDMRVNEYLRYRARLKGLHGRRLGERVDAVVESCGLREELQSIIGHLSKGFRQRLGLADSLVHEPELLILDEPTIGLDPNQIRNIRALIKSLAQRHTVLLSSHILSEIEMVCERVLIISRGRIVVSDTPSNLMGKLSGGIRIVAEIAGPRDLVLEKLKAIPGITQVADEPAGEWTRFTCECQEGTDMRRELFKVVSYHNWALRELSVEKGNLEDVFAAVTGQDHAGESQTDTDPTGEGI